MSICANQMYICANQIDVYLRKLDRCIFAQIRCSFAQIRCLFAQQLFICAIITQLIRVPAFNVTYCSSYVNGSKQQQNSSCSSNNNNNNNNSNNNNDKFAKFCIQSEQISCIHFTIFHRKRTLGKRTCQLNTFH